MLSMVKSPIPILEVVRSASLFAQLDAQSAGLQRICEAAREVGYAQGEVLFREGDPGDSLFLIVEGEVRILKGEVQVAELSEPGQCVGEMALITDEPRSATVEAIAPTILLEITRQAFYLALETDRSIAQGVFRALNRKLQDNLQEMVKSARREIAREESMRMAADIQRSLLPSGEIRNAAMESAGYCQAADLVGGDFFDYLTLSDGRFALLIADVMGHSLHSAMVMAMVKSGLHTQIRFDSSIDGVLGAVDRIVEQQIGAFIFLTVAYVVLDPEMHQLEYANAGGPPMLLYRAEPGDILELASAYPPPGLLPADAECRFGGQRVSWRSGDLLVLSSDGLLEAEGLDREMYGLDRLKECLGRLSTKCAADIRSGILKDLRTFTAANPQRDDITLVVVKAG